MMQENLKHYKVILALGSNHVDALVQLERAFYFIKTLGEISNFSSVYESKPVGFISNNHFSNMALELSTSHLPLELLRLVLNYENNQGRIRLDSGYTDRPIDIDIIRCDDMVINTKDLWLPHPRYKERDFVMIPILEMENDEQGNNPFHFQNELARLKMAHSLVGVQVKKSEIAQHWIK